MSYVLFPHYLGQGSLGLEFFVPSLQQAWEIIFSQALTIFLDLEASLRV